MKKFNWAKRGATAVVMAGLLATAMPATALATTITDMTTFGDKKASEIVLVNKSYTAPVDYTGTFSFNFKYNPDDSVKQGTNDLETPTVKDANKDGSWTVAMDKASWSNGDKDTLSILDAFNNVDFSAPGQYAFDVTEVDPKNNNIAYDSQTYQVIVNVTWPDNYPTDKTPVIESVKVKNKSTEAGAAKKVDNMTFTNSGVTGTGTLEVTKKVAGTAANTSDTFEFKVVLGGTASGSYKGTIKTAGSDQTQDVTLMAGPNGTTVTLGHDQTLTVDYLPAGTTWNVTETNMSNYDSATVEGSELEEGDTTADTSKDVNQANANGKFTEGGSDSKDVVTFTNNKGFAPNTGITMNTLPFVAVAAVAVAGGVTLIISRNRRAHEDF